MTYQEAHNNAQKRLNQQSEEVFVHLPAAVDDLYFHVASGLEQPLDTSRHVAMMIVLRLKQEAHAVRSLLGLGYPVQALSLAANMVELAYDLLYLRDDEARALQWHNHQSLEQNVWRSAKFKARMKDGLQALSYTPELVNERLEADYGMYGVLCAAKHGNPMLQKTTGGTIKDGVLTLGPQDYTQAADLLSAALAMNAVASTTDLAARVVARYHLPEALHEEMADRLNTLVSRFQPALDALTRRQHIPGQDAVRSG